MLRKNDLKKLIETHRRRLQKRKEQEALQGITTDPAILIEIENIEAKIEEMEAELRALEGGGVQKDPPSSQPEVRGPDKASEDDGQVRTEKATALPQPDKPLLDLPRELSEECAKGNVVLFCGAGISSGADGLPTGSGLMQTLVHEADLGDITSRAFPEVMQEYEVEMGRHRLVSKIIELVGRGRAGRPLPPHELIATLPFNRIVTTNWDSLLERALDQTDKLYDVVIDDSDIPFVNQAHRWLIKLHGSPERKESLIITDDDYNDFLQPPTKKMVMVQGFFAQQTLLFLGFSLTDPDFKYVYQQVTRDLGDLKRRAFAVQLNPRPIDVKYWSNKNVQLIEADATHFLQSLQTKWSE